MKSAIFALFILSLAATSASTARAEKDVGNGWGNSGPQIQSGQSNQQQQQSAPSQEQTQNPGSSRPYYSGNAGKGDKKTNAVSIEEITCEQEGGKTNLEIKIWLRSQDHAVTGELPGVSLRSSSSASPLWGGGYEFYRKKEKRHYFTFMPVQKDLPIFYFYREKGSETFPGFWAKEQYRCRYSKRAADVSRIGF